MILYATLGLCALVATAVVVRHDLYDREPLWALLLAAVLGAAATPLLGLAETAILTRFLSSPPPEVAAAVVAAVEEGGRLVVILAVAMLVGRHFNDPLDGLVYGALTGVGMALWESVDRLGDLPAGTASLPPVEVVRVFGHMVLGGIVGFPLGPLRVGPRRGVVLFAACLPAALALHYVVDRAAMERHGDGGAGGGDLGVAAAMLAGISLFAALVATGRRWSRRRFGDAEGPGEEPPAAGAGPPPA